MKNYRKIPIPLIFFIALAIFLFLFTSCNRPVKNPNTATATAVQSTDTAQEDPTVEPTATQPPLAASVNGEGILLELINNEILRYMKAYPETTITEAYDVVVQNQVDLLLLAQSARIAGFSITPDQLDERILRLSNEFGSPEQFNQWLADNHYTDQTFREALTLFIEADHQRSFIADQIPSEMDQVELSQILVYDETTAAQIQSALDAGTDFDWLVTQYHPVSRGYLGWHAPGTLLQPALEQAAFTLEPGQHSSAIQTDYGYHFIKVMNKGLHPLSIQNRQTLERESISDWIAHQREISEIIILASVEE